MEGSGAFQTSPIFSEAIVNSPPHDHQRHLYRRKKIPTVPENTNIMLLSYTFACIRLEK